MDALKKLIRENLKLPSPPSIAIKILETVRKDDFTFKELAGIIETDPSLVGKILKMANSSYYNFVRKVTNIETAISILGTHAVKNIALSFVICGEMKCKENAGFDFDLYWRRAITAAVAADMSAKFLNIRSPDIFVTALLQDIGVIVFNTSLPERYQLIMKENLAGQAPLNEIEKLCLGFDHQDLGAELLRSWQLPEDIYIPILNHHRNEQVPLRYRNHIEILKISDCLSAIYNGNKSVSKVRMVQSRMKETFGVQEEAVDKLVDDVASQSLELLSSFEISPGALRPFSTILQEANEELGKLNTSYELMVIELRQAKEKAEMLANELHLANLKLHELAFRDALTGLYNHRFFQEALDRELEKAVLCQRDLSLMILDIDHFKKVNDTYGHPVGDKVLAAISRAAERNVQSADIVARYGGEEFAVILPEADFMGAAAIAEQVRSGIERLEIDAEGIIIKTTVSIGYTSFRSSARKPDKKAIIGMADKALYIAKQSGRNRVHAMRMAGM